MNNQQKEISIRYRIEDIMHKERNLILPKGVNLSQAKKQISKITFLPMKQLQVQKVFLSNQDQGEEIESDNNKLDTYILEDKTLLMIGLQSFQQDILDFQFTSGAQIKSFTINVYKSDTLYNLRTKIWMELKNELNDMQFEVPQKIIMSIGGQNQVKINDEDLHKEVSEFIREKNIKVFNKKYHLDYVKDNQGRIEIMLNDSAFESTGMLKVEVDPILNSEEDILNIIRLFQEKVQNNQQYKNILNNQMSLVDPQNFLIELFRNGSLEITIAAKGNESDIRYIQSFVKGEPLNSGSVLIFALVGSQE